MCVRPSRDAFGEWPISTAGGVYPRWRQDGRELFFVSYDRKMMAVEISSNGPDLQLGIPKALFDLKLPTVFFPAEPIAGPATAPYPYAVTADGQRFLVAVDQVQTTATAPITVVVNWVARPRK